MTHAVVYLRKPIEEVGPDCFAYRSQIRVNVSIDPAGQHGHYSVLKAFAD